MQHELSFRTAVPADALCIGGLGTQVFLDTYAQQGMRPALAREVLEHFSVAATEALLADASIAFILAESAGHLVGFVQVMHGARHELVPHSPTAELHRIYVHERFTAQGIGAALLLRAERLAATHGAAALWLTAWVGNPRATGFYTKKGYTDVGATDYVFEDDHYENRVFVKELVTLEPQLAAHAEDMFTLLGDPVIYEHENEPPASVDWLRERFVRLESRRSPDGRQQWLNWVIRLPASGLAGYVQATVHADGRAAIAYVLGSRYWGRGLARQAVEAMIAELESRHGVLSLSAVLKRDNARSMRLLERLGFTPAPVNMYARLDVEPDEVLMLRDVRAP